MWTYPLKHRENITTWKHVPTTCNLPLWFKELSFKLEYIYTHFSEQRCKKLHMVEQGLKHFRAAVIYNNNKIVIIKQICLSLSLHLLPIHTQLSNNKVNVIFSVSFQTRHIHTLTLEHRWTVAKHFSGSSSSSAAAAQGFIDEESASRKSVQRSLNRCDVSDCSFSWWRRTGGMNGCMLMLDASYLRYLNKFQHIKTKMITSCLFNSTVYSAASWAEISDTHCHHSPSLSARTCSDVMFTSMKWGALHCGIVSSENCTVLSLLINSWIKT